MYLYMRALLSDITTYAFGTQTSIIYTRSFSESDKCFGASAAEHTHRTKLEIETWTADAKMRYSIIYRVSQNETSFVIYGFNICILQYTLTFQLYVIQTNNKRITPKLKKHRKNAELYVMLYMGFPALICEYFSLSVQSHIVGFAFLTLTDPGRRQESTRLKYPKKIFFPAQILHQRSS